MSLKRFIFIYSCILVKYNSENHFRWCILTFEIALMYVLVLLVFAAFVWEKYPPAVIAMSASAALIAFGVLDTSEFLSVFSNSAPITIAMMFIISTALERTGVIQLISKLLIKAAKGSTLKGMFVMMLFVILASAFMNNTPVVIILTPVVISLAATINIAPSKLLIPLSFASIFGGTLTLIGTSTNILMSTIAVEAGQPAISMFEMTAPGLIFAAVGMLYMMTVGRFLLPERYSLSNIINKQQKRRFIAEILITHHSKFIDQTVDQLKLADDSKIMDVIRGSGSMRGRLKTIRLKGGDRVIIHTNTGELVGLKEDGDVEFKQQGDDFEPVSAGETILLEASVNINSSLIGKRVSDLNLQKIDGMYILAVHRNNNDFHKDFDQIQLRFADTLLIQGRASRINDILSEGDIINLNEPQDRPIRRRKAPIAIAVILAVMVLAALNILPIAGLTVVGASLVLLFRCVDPDEAFRSIDWNILFIIFGMLGLSIGLQNTGAAHYLISGIAVYAEQAGPLWTMFFIYCLTSFLTESVSNNAVAVLIGPIVITLAVQLGYDPRAFIMAVMFAASASFATPVGYQTNTFVYGAGSYKFMDFVKVGLPLNVIFALLAVIIIPWYFPF